MKGFTALAELVEINAHLDLGIQNQLQDPVDVELSREQRPIISAKDHTAFRDSDVG